MSFTTTLLPILSVVAIAQEQLHLQRWIPTNQTQTIFIDTYYSKRSELKRLEPQELSSCASYDVKVVNRFLKERGFSIQLDEGRGHGLAVASILDIALTWKIPGTKTTLSVETTDIHENLHIQEFPAVNMKYGYSIYPQAKNGYIIALGCTNGDTVYMATDATPRASFELLDHIKHLSSLNYKDITEQFSDIIFPMVSIDQEVDIRWLCGLTNKENWFIDQALQQTRFQMDEKGAAVQSAVAISAIRCCLTQPKPTLEINKPFYLWIRRPGMSLPLFAAYIDLEDWKQPVKDCQK